VGQNPEQQRFIERLGNHFEEQGLPRIGGRLLAALMLAPEPASLDDLAEALQVSKGSMSSNARMLERSGILERVKLPRDRRDYYRIAEDAQSRVLRGYLEQMKAFLDALEFGYATVPREQAEVRQRFEEMMEMTRVILARIRRDLEGSG
jgi:DNA-binding transcriptional regulator GbsR (MarR family)